MVTNAHGPSLQPTGCLFQLQKDVFESIHCISVVEGCLPLFLCCLGSHTKALVWVEQRKTEVLGEKIQNFD